MSATPTPELAPSLHCDTSGWKAQFAHPRGRLGSLVGHLMARKNRRINEAVLTVLDPQPGERILEIGSGPGWLLAHIAERVGRDGRALAVDPSAVMVEQAKRRSHEGLSAGTVRIWQATAESLPIEDHTLDAVVEVNSLHHWNDRDRGLTEVRRVLKSEGRLVLALRMRHPTRTLLVAPGYTDDEVERVRDWLGDRGMSSRVEVRPAGDREVRCVLAGTVDRR